MRPTHRTKKRYSLGISYTESIPVLRSMHCIPTHADCCRQLPYRKEVITAITPPKSIHSLPKSGNNTGNNAGCVQIAGCTQICRGAWVANQSMSNGVGERVSHFSHPFDYLLELNESRCQPKDLAPTDFPTLFFEVRPWYRLPCGRELQTHSTTIDCSGSGLN